MAASAQAQMRAHGAEAISSRLVFLPADAQKEVMWSDQIWKRISYHPDSVKKENDARK